MNTQAEAPYRPDIQKAGASKLKWLKFLVMGNSGSGKTTFGATAKNALVLMAEVQGAQSVRKVNPDCDVVLINSWEEMQRLSTWIQKMIRDIDEGRLEKGEFPYDTIVLDSFHDVQGLLERDMMGKDASKIRLSRDEYGLLGTRSKNLLEFFKRLPRHVIVITKADEWQDGEELKIRPGGVGRQAPKDLPYYFNIVAYAFKRIPEKCGRPEYFLLTDGHDKYITKGDPALAPVEVQNAQYWIERLLSKDTTGQLKPAQIDSEARPMPPDPTAANPKPKPTEKKDENKKNGKKGGAK